MEVYEDDRQAGKVDRLMDMCQARAENIIAVKRLLVSEVQARWRVPSARSNIQALVTVAMASEADWLPESRRSLLLEILQAYRGEFAARLKRGRGTPGWLPGAVALGLCSREDVPRRLAQDLLNHPIARNRSCIEALTGMLMLGQQDWRDIQTSRGASRIFDAVLASGGHLEVPRRTAHEILGEVYGECHEPVDVVEAEDTWGRRLSISEGSRLGLLGLLYGLSKLLGHDSRVIIEASIALSTTDRGADPTEIYLQAKARRLRPLDRAPRQSTAWALLDVVRSASDRVAISDT